MKVFGQNWVIRYCAYTIQRPIIMEDCRFWALVSILSFSVSPAYRVTGDKERDLDSPHVRDRVPPDIVPNI